MGRPTNAEIEARRLAAGEDSPTPQATALAAPMGAIAEAPLNLEDDIARIRALRDENPFGTFDQKMKLSPIQGYKLHWFNDKPGRVDMAMRAGWAYIMDNDGKPRTLIVDSGGLKAYAMKIPEQFWAEDQARQNAKAESALAAVKKKPTGAPGMAKPSDQGAFYTPDGKTDAATITRA